MAFKQPLIILTIIILFAGIANSAEEKKFSGEGEIGLLITSGNSDTESVNAKLGLKYETGKMLSEAKISALYSSEETEVDGKKEDNVSAEKYNYFAKAGYKFNEANYVFITGAYEDDRFSGYDYRTSFTVGYGRKVIQNDTINLNIELGPGYRYDKQHREWINGEKKEEIENEAIFRGYGMFSYKFTDTASFQQDVTVETGSDNTVTESVTAVKSQIVGAVSMKASFTLTHHSSPPEDKDKTDTETALTLVYDF
jgi:putative salt-induced outer membrane protein